MKSAIGLDLGSTTGWASYNDGLFQGGVWRLTPTRFDSQSMRFVNFEMKLRELVRVVQPQQAFYERVHRHLGVTAAHVYGAFLGKMQETLDELGVPYTGLSVQQIKIHATGKGNAPKIAMVKLAAKRWPHLEIPTDDTADALWCVSAGLELYKTCSPSSTS